MKAYTKERENTLLTLVPFTELNYERAYSATSLTLMFFLFSTTGWVWEVLIHLIEDNAFINRGLLTGPWLPIYGFGGVLILVLFKNWRDRPFHLAGLIMLSCGVIEYITSLALEGLFGARWWDYSDLLFNIDGRVCLEGLLIFGIGGLVFVYVIAPKMDDWLMKFTKKGKITLSTILLTLFICDFIRACIVPNMGFGITI